MAEKAFPLKEQTQQNPEEPAQWTIGN